MSEMAPEAAAYKWAYEYLQSRMESIGRDGWAHDCDGEIQARIAAATGSLDCISENARLREALTMLAEEADKAVKHWYDTLPEARVLEIARAALGNSDTSKGARDA